MIYHVSVNGCDNASGTADSPFRTINHAAGLAVSGDTVLVHNGEYREWVDPKNGGLSETQRIVYEAAPGEHPVIKGSEIVTDWEKVEGSVWKKELPNSMFGDWNPYGKKIEGDWLIMPRDYDVHLGEVYLNGIAMYEAKSLEDVYIAEKRLTGCLFYRLDKIIDPENTVYQWYAQVKGETTTIWCNFQQIDPNSALVEINVRKCCFFPRATGLNYITVRGFEMAHSACPFTPPTADQPGMIGPHWSKGWIIENNHFHDAKCSAVSLGKEAGTGDNLHFHFKRKSGYTYQKEAVFKAIQTGWSKDKIGSHIVRNNIIHDCGQNGIVGHMGCAFSRIEHNHIYNIAMKQEFWGHEIAGIKLHAPIDVIIENNNIHNCSLGTWLDWQAQGTRITRNLYHNNDRDLMIEVTHGPCLVDNNIFLSKYVFDDFAQGTAFIHNLAAGVMRNVKVLDRSTPYHFPHSTQVAGCEMVYGGDDRIMNNIFLGAYELPYNNCGNFSDAYNEYTLPEEYYPLICAEDINNDHVTYVKVPQPVWIEGNAYAGNAKPYRAEKDAISVDEISASIEEINGEWILTLNVPKNISEGRCSSVTTEWLGAPRITEEPYENPDGTPINFTRDYLCRYRSGRIIPGPFGRLNEDKQQIVVWKV